MICLFVWFWIWCALQILWMLWLLVLYGFPKNDIIDYWWFGKVMNYKRLPNAYALHLSTWCENCFTWKLVLVACIGERSVCGLRGKCPIAWSWSWHLWPTVVEWHRWDIFIYMDWVCLEGSWKGMTLLRHYNIELIMVHHMSEFKPTPRKRGLDF